TSLEAVVTQRALPRAPVIAPSVDHTERTGRHAVAAAVAHVLLHHDRAELGTEQRAGRAHLETRGVGAVLAHVRRHAPPHPARPSVATGCGRPLDERDVPPGVGAQAHGVVVGVAREADRVLRNTVPFLARDLAGLAADAQRG